MIASEGHLFGWITEGATLMEALRIREERSAQFLA